MIPWLGKLFPFCVAVLGVFDTIYTWFSSNPERYRSIFIGIVTVYLIHLLYKDHEASHPKHAWKFFVSAIVSIAIILIESWWIFL